MGFVCNVSKLLCSFSHTTDENSGLQAGVQTCTQFCLLVQRNYHTLVAARLTFRERFLTPHVQTSTYFSGKYKRYFRVR